MVALLEATVDVPVPVDLIPTDSDEIARCGKWERCSLGESLEPASVWLRHAHEDLAGGATGT